MNKRIDESVAVRAYELWEKAGRPKGRDEEFWRLAEQEVLNEDKGSPLRTPDTLYPSMKPSRQSADRQS
jgi:hypothetical protein